MASERVRPSQRFQRLLDQLSECHEEETWDEGARPLAPLFCLCGINGQ